MSPLVIHILIAGSIFALDLIKLIPMAVLFGLFCSWDSHFRRQPVLGPCDDVDHDKERYPDTEYVRKVPIKVISAFTLIQVVSLAALWVLKSAHSASCSQCSLPYWCQCVSS